MSTLFHVSPQKFVPGQILELRRPTPHFQKYTRGFAPAAGLSPEALRILAELREHRWAQCPYRARCWAKKTCRLVAGMLYDIVELLTRAHAFVEHLFDREREKHFSELPSRFTCFFCWESLEAARWFWQEYRGGEGFVYRVKPAVEDARFHRGDMKWLDCLMLSVEEIQKRAAAYWRGEMCPDPGGGKWEVLGPCDLVVLEEVPMRGDHGLPEAGKFSSG